MEKDTKEKFTCPHCKKTGEKIKHINYNYCPFCGKSVSSTKS